VVVGTVQQFPTKTSARKAAEPLQAKAIADNSAVPVTVQQLVKHYTDNELPSKAYSSERTIETTLKIWVIPKGISHNKVYFLSKLCGTIASWKSLIAPSCSKCLKR
jgi:hypothetical protein